MANIFAPFSVFIGQKNDVRIEKNTIEAAVVLADPLDEAMRKAAKAQCLETQPTDPKTELCFKARYSVVGEKVTFKAYTIGVEHSGLNAYHVTFIVKDSNNKVIEKLDTVAGPFSKDVDEQNVDPDTEIVATYAKADPKIKWSGRLFTSKDVSLDLNTNYKMEVVVEKFSDGVKVDTKSETLSFKTGSSTDISQGSTQVQEATPNTDKADFLPDCVEGFADIDLVGCAIVLYYNVLFVPTSYLFGLAGKFFDATFGYSIMDTSYRTGFVTEGWAIVRDFCNLFFIFVLIYAAFGMILSIHSIKAKEIIINTILIGLLINFSLLAGQLMIDSSNILARVFYNSEAIKITVDKDGGVVDRGGVNMYEETIAMGQLPLSAALVSKVDPQNLIINGKDNIQSVQSKNTTDDYQGLTAGGWFLLITLAVIVNVIGAFVFLSVGLIFVARVIGLWFALIFAPLAFFSYTVPQMQGIAMVGWKKWWPETMGLAFVAPIFMFFMYLILVFLEKGFASLMEASSGPNFVLSIIIPFAFIMILLMTAKKLAKTYSGQMGQMITGAVTSVGGMALGGAALGVAFAGRQTMGRFSKAIINDSSSQKAFREKGTNPAAWDNLNGWQKFKGRVGSNIVKHEKDVGEKSHSEHVLNEKAQAVTGRKDAVYKDLNADSKKDVRDALDRDLVSKEMFGKTYDRLKAPERTAVEASKTLNGNNWKDAAEFARANAAIENRVVHTADHMDHSSKYGKGLVGGTKAGIKQLGSQSRTGSYDVRNLSQMKALPSSWLSKFGVGLIAGVAMGVRTALKSGVDLEHGKGQKDLFKDLAHTISESVKHSSSKIASAIKDVSSAGHGDGGHDDHGGGHDDHGHGGGGGGHH